jgi:hypothetical protein
MTTVLPDIVGQYERHEPFAEQRRRLRQQREYRIVTAP